MVTLKTNFGDITLELFEDKAPKTVANFLSYVEDGFFDNTIFHRVINNFMIQGGGFTPDMEQKDTKDPIGLELGLEDDNSVFLEPSKEDQEIVVLMTTPNGCKAEAKKTVPSNKAFKLDPKYQQPKLQNPQMNPIQRRRGGFLMRGNK